MENLLILPLIICLLFVFLIGTAVGSFLNVLIARLPFEKSPVWPGSRSFHCLQPIPLQYNLPIVGYLLLRGRCGMCGAAFSGRYLWVELGTGLALTGLFVLEILLNWHNAPGLAGAQATVMASVFPPAKAIVYFFFHGTLLCLLIACAVIDAEHRIIPPQITYFGAVLGIVASMLFPWPWPNPVPAPGTLSTTAYWIVPEIARDIPTGMTLWPFAGPPPAWAPMGSWKLGLLNGLIGAAAGTFLVRSVKFLFEYGMGREALGLGDADLLMMAGAFLGWQAAVIGFFVGAFAALLLKVPVLAWDLVQRRTVQRELSFGPGLAVGIVATWLGWRWISPSLRMLFDPVIVVIVTAAMGGALLIAGLILRRRSPEGEA
jgi:leader peptidase (prepilin peptidase)/N-methyltransferase